MAGMRREGVKPFAVIGNFDVVYDASLIHPTS